MTENVAQDNITRELPFRIVHWKFALQEINYVIQGYGSREITYQLFLLNAGWIAPMQTQAYFSGSSLWLQPSSL